MGVGLNRLTQHRQKSSTCPASTCRPEAPGRWWTMWRSRSFAIWRATETRRSSAPFWPNNNGQKSSEIQRYITKSLENSCFLNLTQESCQEMHSILNELYYWGILKCQQGSCSRNQRPRVSLPVNPNAMGSRVMDHNTNRFTSSEAPVEAVGPFTYGIWVLCVAERDFLINKTFLKQPHKMSTRVAPIDAVRGLRQRVLAQKSWSWSLGHHIFEGYL